MTRFPSLQQEVQFFTANNISLQKVRASTLRFCPLCDKELVGYVLLQHSVEFYGHNAICVPGNRICDTCEDAFTRKKVRPSYRTAQCLSVGDAEKKNNRFYKQWLANPPAGTQFKFFISNGEGGGEWIYKPMHG